MSTEEPRTESTPQRSEASPGAIATAKRFGAPMIVRGILGVVFGIVTVFWPRDSINPTQLSLPTDVVDHLAIGYLILFACALVYEAARAPIAMRTAIYGQAIITVPAILFLFLADQPPEVRAALSIWAILHGALEFWSYRQLKSQPMSSDFLISAGVHVLLGVILIFGDGMQALSILGFSGAATLIAGVIFIIGGYSRLSKARQLTRRGDRPEQIDTPAEAAAPTPATDEVDAATDDSEAATSADVAESEGTSTSAKSRTDGTSPSAKTDATDAESTATADTPDDETPSKNEP
jgi:uncharacterized membrane protein HdeD (DUF308 family)